MSMALESEEVRLQNLRERLRKMSDQDLIQFGKSVRQLCGNHVSSIRSPFEVQLEEARAEWLRRHPRIRLSADPKPEE